MPLEARQERLLLVEDDDVLRGRLGRALRERGFDVHEAGDAESALVAAEASHFERAVVDLRLPGRPGIDVVRALARRDPPTAIVVLTGYGSIATALEAVRLGARHYLTKPAHADAILAGFTPDLAPAEPSSTATPSLARVEWEHIQRVLGDCGGNVSAAARALGLHRRTLQRKLLKFPNPR